MIDRHYLNLRQRYPRAVILVFIEANSSFIDADRIHKQLAVADKFGIDMIRVQRYDPKGKNNRFGIWTTQDTKDAYVDQIRRFYGGMRFVESNAWITNDSDEMINIQKFYEQCKNFHREIEEPAKQGTQDFYKSFWTGKGQGKRDDLIMALGIALYYMDKKQTEPEFLKWRREAFGSTCGA